MLGVGRSLNGRCWRLRPCDERAALAIAQRHDLPEMLGRILSGRGVSIDAAESFLHPSLQNDLPDPACLMDMERAAERLARAVMANEKIAVFGDCARVIGHVRLTLKNPDGTTRTVNGRFMNLWVKRNGTWQMTGWQSTPIPA